MGMVGFIDYVVTPIVDWSALIVSTDKVGSAALSYCEII